MASRPAAPPLLPRVAPDAEPVAPDASVERAHAWRPPWRAAAIVLGAWTLVALVGTQQALLSMWRNGEPLDWTHEYGNGCKARGVSKAACFDSQRLALALCLKMRMELDDNAK